MSIHVPDDLVASNARTCVKCLGIFHVDDFAKIGFVSLYTEEEKAKRYAWALYSIEKGPRPKAQPPEPFMSRFWLAVKALFKRKVPEPWEKYPPLN